MFKKQDEEFDEMIADPVRRRAKIADLSWRRTCIGVCAIGFTVCTVASAWCAKGAGGMGVVAISYASVWIIFFKTEADLRLFRAIERLQKDKEPRPAA
jgi:hypothetical protein